MCLLPPRYSLQDLRNLKKARNGVLRSYIAQLSSDSSAAEASSHRPQPESAAPNPEKIDRRAKEKRKLPVPAAQKAPALDHDDVRIEVKREDAASTDIDEGSPGQRAKLRKRALSHDVSSSARAPIGNKDGHTADVMEASETKPTKEATVAVGAGEGGRPESGFKGMGLLSLPDNGVVGGGWSEPHENHAPSPPPGQQGNSRWLQVFKQSDDVSNPPVRFRCPDTPAESEKVSHSGVGKGRPLRGSRGGGLSWAQAPPNGDGPAENQLSDADVAPPYEVLAEMEPSTEQCFFTATRSKVLPGMGLTSGTVGKDESCGAGIKRKAERCDLEDILRSLGPPQVIESKLEHSGGVAPLSGIGCGGDGLPRTQSGFSGGGVGSAEWWGARNVPPQSGQFRKPCPLEIADNPAALPMQSPHVSTPSLHETFRSSPTSSNLTSGFCPTLSVQTPVTSAPLPGASVVRSLTEPLPLFYPGAEAGSDTNLSLTSLVMDHINGLLDQQAEKLSRVDPSVPESSTIFSGELFEQHSQLRAALEFLTTLTARAKPEDGPGIPRALPAKSAASNHSPTETSREPAPANPFVIGKPTEEQPWALKSSVQEPTAPKFWTAVKDEYGGDVTGGINQDGPLTAGAQQDPPRGFAPTSEWQPFSLQGHVEPEPGATCCPGKAPVDTVFMGPTTPVTSDWDERLNELTWTEGGAFGGFQSGP